MSSSMLVLDANILIRAVLGNKVRTILTTYAGTVDFFTPDVCMADAQKYLPLLFEKRSLPAKPALTLLASLECLLHIVDENVYKSSAEDARLRIKSRDIRDWPVVATALTLNSAIWTEDQDFFGSGIPTWTTDRIHIFLNHLLPGKILFNSQYLTSGLDPGKKGPSPINTHIKPLQILSFAKLAMINFYKVGWSGCGWLASAIASSII